MPMPVGIQRKRTKGFNLQAVSKALNGLEAVCVDRSTKWGNLFHLRKFCKSEKGDKGDCVFCRDTAEEAVAAYRIMMFQAGREAFPYWELRGKNLACWCALDGPCHRVVLLELANPCDCATGSFNELDEVVQGGLLRHTVCGGFMRGSAWKPLLFWVENLQDRTIRSKTPSAPIAAALDAWIRQQILEEKSPISSLSVTFENGESFTIDSRWHSHTSYHVNSCWFSLEPKQYQRGGHVLAIRCDDEEHKPEVASFLQSLLPNINLTVTMRKPKPPPVQDIGTLLQIKMQKEGVELPPSLFFSWAT